MNEQRRRTERTGFKLAVTRTDAIRRLLSTRQVAASVPLLITLAACGGGNGSDATPNITTHGSATPTLESTAALAAKSTTVPLALSLKMGRSNLPADASVNRFIVKYKSATTEGTSTAAVQLRLDRLAGALPAKARHSRRLSRGADLIVTDRELNGKEANALMRAIASDPNVEYVEPDAEVTAQMVPNDPEYTQQWALYSDRDPAIRNPGIRAEGAWDIASGAGVVTAVVDDGVTNHNDLNANYLPGRDFTGYDWGGNGMNPGPTSYTCSTPNWHGTHVAGILAARTNNGYGVAGVAPAAKIVSVRVLNACGIGALSDVADGIVWAAGGSVPGAPDNANPARIINLSLGSGVPCGPTIQSALDYAVSRGAVVVAAAMNDGGDASNYTPANCGNVVSVAATNRYGQRWPSSNYGAVVDIAAPGENIWSTYNSGASAPGAESYSFMSGTSMATPMVGGVMALIQSIAPKPLTTAELRTLLQQTAQAFPSGPPDHPIGPGLLDATAAVAAAKAGRIPAAADFKCTQTENSMQVTCVDLSTARGIPIRRWAWNLGTGAPDIVSTQSSSPTLYFDYPGDYLIRLAVTDNNGAVSTYVRKFTVKAPLVVDLTGADSVYAVNTYLDENVPKFFSVTLPQSGIKSLIVPTGYRDLTFTVTPQSSNDTLTLSTKAETVNMVNPDCTAVMTQGNPAKCVVNPTNQGGTFYAMTKSSKAVGGIYIGQKVTYWNEMPPPP